MDYSLVNPKTGFSSSNCTYQSSLVRLRVFHNFTIGVALKCTVSFWFHRNTVILLSITLFSYAASTNSAKAQLCCPFSSCDISWNTWLLTCTASIWSIEIRYPSVDNAFSYMLPVLVLSRLNNCCPLYLGWQLWQLLRFNFTMDIICFPSSPI